MITYLTHPLRVVGLRRLRVSTVGRLWKGCGKLRSGELGLRIPQVFRR